MEIGVGTTKLDKQTRISGENLIIEDEIIEFLKTHLLFTLSKKDETAGGVADAVAENFNKLPGNVRDP